MTARKPPWEQNGLPPMANIMQIASAKSRSMRGASHQPGFIGSCLTISHMCLPCLPGGGWVSPCVLWPLVTGLMVVLLTSFLWWVWFYLWGVDAFLGNGCGIEGHNYVVLLQGSKMYAGFRDVLGLPKYFCSGGLADSKRESRRGDH